MDFCRAFGVHQAHRLMMIAEENRQDGEGSAEGPSKPGAGSPTLAGYIVYVVTVIGFLTMCVLGALR